MNYEDIQIGKAQLTDAASIAAIHIESWLSTYKGIVPANYLAALSHQEKTMQWQTILANNIKTNAQITFVAESPAKEIIGFISGGLSREKAYPYDAELYAVYLRQDYQNKRLGSNLVRTLVGWLLEQDYRAMLVWVLEKNPACLFYQRLGGRLLPGKKRVSFCDEQLIEVAYAWESLPELLGLLQK